jgi:hypothetical protein
MTGVSIARGVGGFEFKDKTSLAGDVDSASGRGKPAPTGEPNAIIKRRTAGII